MTRVATVKNEEYLLMIATHGTAAHVERLVSKYRMVKRIEALEQENTRHAQRELSWFVDDDGYWVVRGRFTLEQGAVIQKVLEQVMESPCAAAGRSRGNVGRRVVDGIRPRSAPIALRADARCVTGFWFWQGSTCWGPLYGACTPT
jgi:hypothetical protein